LTVVSRRCAASAGTGPRQSARRRPAPVDILRFELAFFGVSKFDPKSDLWTRVNMYQGAPLPHEITETRETEWAFPTRPTARSAKAVT
jgi:hypothetical protein